MAAVDEAGQRLAGAASAAAARAAEAGERFANAARESIDDLRDYLATDEGRELRARAAGAVILAAPVLAELPVFRRSPLGRLLRAAAVATLLVRGAEWVRDWEPRPRPRVGRA